MKALPLQTPAQLADHLRSFRKARGLTQAAARPTDRHRPTRITRIERSPGRVSVHTLLQLLTALRVRVLLEPLEATKISEEPPTDW